MTETQQHLLWLLNCALHKAQGHYSPVHDISPSLWAKTILLADKQEVYGLAFDALEKLDRDLLPPNEMLLTWTAHVCGNERDYRVYRQMCINGLQTFEANNIPFVLMKGLLIANLYPKPEHRPIGDVDLLFDRRHYAQAIELFGKQGANIDQQPDGKHATAVHLGINWEFHFKSIYFFNYISERRYRQLEQQETTRERLCIEAIDENHSADSLPPLFRMLYLTAHIQHHLLLEEIKMRHVVDWMLVLQHNRTALAIGESPMTQQLERLGLKRLFRALGYIATHHLGMDGNSYAGCTQFSPKEEARGNYLLKIILEGHIPGCQPYQMRSSHDSFTTKARLFGELIKRCIKLKGLIPQEAIAAPLGLLLNAIKRRLGIRHL